VTITAVKMSDSELSDLPSDPESYSQIEEPSLPHLIPQYTPIQPSVEAVNGSLSNILQHPRVVLPPTSSKLFTKGLYRPLTIKMVCLQPDCEYSIPSQGLKQSSTGNC
jgi:hypothetical protein